MFKSYTDTIHGFNTQATHKLMAWCLIRSECHRLGLEVPTLDKIIELKNQKPN